MTAMAQKPVELMLPELRQELRLHAGPRGDGSLHWLIYDPVRHRYFHVSRSVFELLEHWRPEPMDAFTERAARDLDRSVSDEDVKAIVTFMMANNLCLQPPKDDPLALALQERKARRSRTLGLVHSYLFFRVPLFRPEGFLKATLPIVEPLYSRATAVAIILVSLLGLYFASRQWDLFVATFVDFLTLEGLFAYGVTLLVIKALHELGHAYTAARAGVRVNTMGIAFMVLTPILYTDVTDAWRLRERRDKLAIDLAGVTVELALAGVALLLWAFLPDGPLRAVAFVTATTSLFIGLFINLNPLMRFDGYYILSDAWRVPNLQPRSNALARWWLREVLFGLEHEPPEPFPPRTRSFLVVYALCVWVYRFFLFLAIALLVYHLFFKALGIILFVIEIIWFILLPIFREFKEWWKMRSKLIATRRTIVSGLLLAAVLAAILIPWRGTVTAQAVALADTETRIFAPRPARVVRVALQDSAAVAGGDVLLVLDSPDLEHEITQTLRRIELTQLRLQRIAGDSHDRANRVVLEEELSRHETNLAGLMAEKERLVVRAPHAGVVRDIDRDLAAGQWIDETVRIARVVKQNATELRGYILEDDVWRVAAGSDVTFVPEDPQLPRWQGRLTEVVGTAVGTLDLPYLASVYGGAVPSDRTEDQEIKPRSGWHMVRAELAGRPVTRALRGTLHVDARPESVAAAIWRRILQVLVRESSA
jgi:putative peptide zinc metalloprotease protein